MKKICFILVALVALSFASCEKDNDAIVFKATMEETSHQGKTTLSGHTLSWSQNDEIKVQCEGAGNWYTFKSESSTPGARNSFYFADEDRTNFLLDADSYNAVYPASLENNGTLTLPAKQKYEEDDVSGFPMYAVTTSHDLGFKNTCGLLKLHIEGNFTVSSIVLSSSQSMCGEVTVGDATSNYAFSVDGANQVTLDCESGVNVSGGKDFYIYLPEDDYSNLEVVAVATNGNAYVKKAANSQDLQIERNKITKLPCDMSSVSPIAPVTLDGDDLYEDVSMHENLTSFIVKCGCSGDELDGCTPLGNGVYSKVVAGTYYLRTSAWQINGTHEENGDGYVSLFMDNSSLTYIDFGDGFNLSGLDLTGLFSQLADLEYLYLGKRFGVPQLATNMFYCVKSDVHIYCSQETKNYLRDNDNQALNDTYLPSTAIVDVI